MSQTLQKVNTEKVTTSPKVSLKMSHILPKVTPKMSQTLPHFNLESLLRRIMAFGVARDFKKNAMNFQKLLSYLVPKWKLTTTVFLFLF